MSSETSRLHAVVQGHVQGVGFRAYVLGRAHALGLTGWVRNTYQGNVEVIAEGPRSQLLKLLSDLQQGPGYVLNVQHDWSEATGEFKGFHVEYTR